MVYIPIIDNTQTGDTDMTQTAFITYLNSTKFPAAILSEVKREARARIIERLQAGRADCVLTFDDLALKLENSLI